MGVASPESKQILLGKLLLDERPNLQPPVHVVAAAREIGILTPNHAQVKSQMNNLINTYFNGVLQLDRHWGIRFAAGSDAASLKEALAYLQEKAAWRPHKNPDVPTGIHAAHRVNVRKK